MAGDRKAAAGGSALGRFQPAAPETVAKARRLYETTTLPLTEIGPRVGLYFGTVGRMARRGGWRRPAAVEARRRLVGSIREKAEKEIVAAEKALASGGDAGAAARTLASLVRTLRELARYDEEQAGGPRRGDDDERDDDLADPDALREALAERLERLQRERGT